MLLIRAVVAFLLLPCLFAGLVPWCLSSWDPWAGQGWAAASLLLLIGLLVLLRCVWDFYVSGKGTLAPWSPPEHLVTVGLYRYTRNPMYLSVLLIIAGWALRAGSPLTAGYLVVIACAFHLRVVMYEEICLAEQFPEQWEKYAAAAPRWLPGLARWRKKAI